LKEKAQLWHRNQETIDIITGRICRKAANCRVKFTQSPKISMFAPQGRLVAPIHVKFSTAEGHAGGSTWSCEISRQSVNGRGNSTQKSKISTFGKELPHRGEPFDRFLQLPWAFIRPTIIH